MLSQQKTDLSPWQKTDLLVEQWLKQRQTLLVIYNQMCHTKNSSAIRFNSQTLQSFCQILMDYLSAGHFKVFEKLAEAYQSHDSSVSYGLNNKLLDRILSTTTIALDFNDKYTNAKDLSNLSHDLGMLGENLAHRMEWEDSLIKTYLHITQH